MGVSGLKSLDYFLFYETKYHLLNLLIVLEVSPKNPDEVYYMLWRNQCIYLVNKDKIDFTKMILAEHEVERMIIKEFNY